MRYFLDTEFIEDGRTIDLISIGVVAADGREFYREVADDEVNWDRDDGSADWVTRHVKPYLLGPSVQRRRVEIAVELREFITSPAEFWGYYADYDWVVLCQLFGTMMDLPLGWPMFCIDLKQLAMSLGNPRLPEQVGIKHHALADAHWNRDVYGWLHLPATGGRVHDG
jgi:hypothetical protein